MIKVESFAKAKNNGNGSGASSSSSKGYANTVIRQNIEGHYLWGQYFDATQDVSGTLKGVGDIEASGDITGKSITTETGSITELTSEKITSETVNTKTINADDGFIAEISSENISNNGKITSASADIKKLISENITTEYLTVTKQAHFWELVIDKIKSTSGAVIVTPANATVEMVTSSTSNGVTSYNLMWRCEDVETNKAIHNEFEVDDQIICQSFNGAKVGTTYNVSNKYYWAKVTGKGTISAFDTIRQTNANWHYITVSTADCDGALSPEVGDEIVMLGNRTDTSRQNAIVISSYNSNYLDADIQAPSIVQYKGIKTYSLKPYRYNTIAANGNTFYGDFKVVNGNTSTDVTDLIEGEKLATIISNYDATFINADSSGKITSVSNATGLPTKIEVYLGGEIIPSSEIQSTSYIQYGNGNKQYIGGVSSADTQTGIYISSITKNAANVVVGWSYRTRTTAVTNTQTSIYIKFIHNGKTYEVNKTIPATVIKAGANGDTIEGDDAEFDRLIVESASATVSIEDVLGISFSAYVQHVKGSEITTRTNLADYTLDLVSNAGDRIEANKSSYFYYSNSSYKTNYSKQANTQKYYTIRLFKGSSKVDEQVLTVTFNAGSIFKVKEDAITAAVQDSKSYTDGEITTVNNKVAEVELTANGLKSTVQSHTTKLTDIESDISEIDQKADKISTRVTNIEGNYITSSELTQTANNIQLNVYDNLKTKTGIDVSAGKITLNAANTTVVGNLNLTDTSNGMTVYDSDSIPRINLQPKAISTITTLANDTYSYYPVSKSQSASSYEITTNEQSFSLSQYETLDIDMFTVQMYSTGSTTAYPSGYYDYLTLTITHPNSTTTTKSITTTRTDSYGNFRNLTEKVRFTAPTAGTYKVKYNVRNSSASTWQSGQTSVYAMVNARYQSAKDTQTYIGKDGFYTHAGANKLIWAGESETQIRYGFNGIRWNDADRFGNTAMQVVTGVKGTTPNYKPVWLPFYNYTPTFSPNFTSQYITNIAATKYAYRIDPQINSGICLVDSGYMDTNFNYQDSYIILPSSTFTQDGATCALPKGYTVTIIKNYTGGNLYVVPYSASKNGAIIIDANANNNYYVGMNSNQQTRETFVYVGGYGEYSGATWISMLDH